MNDFSDGYDISEWNRSEVRRIFTRERSELIVSPGLCMSV